MRGDAERPAGKRQLCERRRADPFYKRPRRARRMIPVGPFFGALLLVSVATALACAGSAEDAPLPAPAIEAGTPPATTPEPLSAAAPPPEATAIPAPATPAPGPGLSGTDAGPDREWVIADVPLPDSRPVVLARWAAITDQRRDVLDLDLAAVLRIMRGDARDWSAFGGSPQPISVYLPASQAVAIADALGLLMHELAADLLPDDELTDRVAATPGAFALVVPERLRLGVLALTVDGHDPYRDPAQESPLRLVRWIRAPAAGDAGAQAAAGMESLPPFDPVGMLVTGELIPVRCTNHVLTALDDYGAMFDGVREAIRAADLAVAPLESPLTDLGEPTPCVETVVLQGSPRVVPALAGAGLDVVLTIGNHMLDCWEGCSGVGALLDTLARLDAAGIVTTGAGPDLAAARAPAVVSVETAQGPVRFAFLGYDAIAPWYAATDGHAGTAPLDAAIVREDVRAAQDRAHHVLVGANWGVEYTADPVAFQRELGGIAVEAGATVVVGSHPHWVQAVEQFDGALVAYSFGNFVFDQNWSLETTQGMLMEFGFTAERLIGYRIRPVVIRAHSSELPWTYRPGLVDPAGQGRPILDRVWEAQDRLPPRQVVRSE